VNTGCIHHWTYHCHCSIWRCSNDELVSDAGSEAVFNPPEGLHMFEYFTDLYQNEIIPHSIITDDQRNGIEVYSSEDAAIYNDGPQFLTQVKENAPDVYENTEVAEVFLGESGKINLTAQG